MSTNISVSGATSPIDCNGTYTLRGDTYYYEGATGEYRIFWEIDFESYWALRKVGESGVLYFYRDIAGLAGAWTSGRGTGTLVVTELNPNQGTKGTKDINKLDIPEGIGDTQNLVFEDSSNVLSKNRVGLELD